MKMVDFCDMVHLPRVRMVDFSQYTVSLREANHLHSTHGRMNTDNGTRRTKLGMMMMGVIRCLAGIFAMNKKGRT